jgi:hypothetical protein
VTTVILAEAQLKPHLFRWNGPVDRGELSKWARQRGWRFSADLEQLWALTGGGDIMLWDGGSHRRAEFAHLRDA